MLFDLLFDCVLKLLLFNFYVLVFLLIYLNLCQKDALALFLFLH